ncbi:MAG TPA: hypothetical protein VEH06_12805 [Candidatus Bathyarchaeia archaeon]|nr:hypothetical protein [Candidatus Bathyarchaeia archaeon]
MCTAAKKAPSKTEYQHYTTIVYGSISTILPYYHTEALRREIENFKKPENVKDFAGHSKELLQPIVECSNN